MDSKPAWQFSGGLSCNAFFRFVSDTGKGPPLPSNSGIHELGLIPWGSCGDGSQRPARGGDNESYTPMKKHSIFNNWPARFEDVYISYFKRQMSNRMLSLSDGKHNMSTWNPLVDVSIWLIFWKHLMFFLGSSFLWQEFLVPKWREVVSFQIIAPPTTTTAGQFPTTPTTGHLGHQKNPELKEFRAEKNRFNWPSREMMAKLVSEE